MMKSVPFAVAGIGLTMLAFFFLVVGLRQFAMAGPLLEQKLAAALGSGLVVVLAFAVAVAALKRGFGSKDKE